MSIEKILESLARDIITAHNNNYGENIWNAEDYAKTQAKQAITSLIKELVAEAMPEPSTNLTSYEAQMFIASTEEYRQNLLKALEEV